MQTPRHWSALATRSSGLFQEAAFLVGKRAQRLLLWVGQFLLPALRERLEEGLPTDWQHQNPWQLTH